MRPLGLVGQTKVGVNAKGELVMPFQRIERQAAQLGRDGSVRVAGDRASHERLAAKVVDGKAVRFSIDGISPFMVFDRVPWYQNSAWLLPAALRKLWQRCC